MTTYNPVTNPKHYDLKCLKQESERVSSTCETLLMVIQAGHMKQLIADLEAFRRDAARFRYLCRYADSLYRLNEKEESACNGNDPHPTTSPETSATRSPDSGLAKG